MSEAAAIMGREGGRSLGAYFAMVREKRGLSIERVAGETHMGVERVRELERDDFSSFPHPSYARMYAIDYAKYLGIPISRVRRMLPEAGGQVAGGYQYLQEKPCDYMRTDFTSPRGPLLKKLATVALLVLVGLSGLKFWITLRDIERLGLSRVASGDTSALAFPGIQNSDPPTSVTPDSSAANLAGAKPEETAARPAESSGRRAAPADARSPALLVGADLDQSDRIR